MNKYRFKQEKLKAATEAAFLYVNDFEMRVK